MIPPFEIMSLLSTLAEPVLWLVSPKFRERTRKAWADSGAPLRIADVLTWLSISAVFIAVALWMVLALLFPAAS